MLVNDYDIVCMLHPVNWCFYHKAHSRVRVYGWKIIVSVYGWKTTVSVYGWKIIVSVYGDVYR